MEYREYYKTFLIGYELPVYKPNLYFLECRDKKPFQYHRNKNGKLYKVHDKNKWV